MNSAEVTFYERKQEIELYFKNLDQLEKSSECDIEFMVILKANAVVLLYNLVEATVIKAFEYVHEEIKREELRFGELSDELCWHWFKSRFSSSKQKSATYKTFEDNAWKILNQVMGNVRIAFEMSDLPISGNIDARQIRRLCDCYGISFACSPNTKGGSVLREIKDGRNSLAHGDLSFVEYGRNLTVQDLQEKKEKVLCFIEDLIRSFELFCENQTYKKN